jgi:hypothetical protein
MEHGYVAEIDVIITSQTEQDPYTAIRTMLVRRLSLSREQCIRQLLTLEMGDRKPSQFLRHLRGLAPDVPENCLYIIWSSRIPHNIYMVCSKSIEPLVGRNKFIDLEVQNPNPLQSSLLGNAHTSPIASAIVGNTSGTRLLEW